jgi:cytochrome c oxidase subunit 3
VILGIDYSGWEAGIPGIQTFDPFHLPLINTLVLLLSGTTVTWAHHALQHGDRKGAKLGTAHRDPRGLLHGAAGV